MYSLRGKEEEEWRGISSKSHENPGGYNRRKEEGTEETYDYSSESHENPDGFTRRKGGRGGEGMYQLLISRKPLG